MRETQAERILLDLTNGRPTWKTGNPSRGLRYCEDIIWYNNQAVAWYEQSDDYEYLVITLIKYLLPERVRGQLAHAANDVGLRVVFTPFGQSEFGTINDERPSYRLLSRVAKFSQDDVQTACFAASGGRVEVVTYNQQIGSRYHHAEEVLIDYITIGPMVVDEFSMLLEPCFNCLLGMADTGATDIYFYEFHKEKWNTDDYLNLRDNIHAKRKRSPSGRTIFYRRLEHAHKTRQ